MDIHFVPFFGFLGDCEFQSLFFSTLVCELKTPTTMSEFFSGLENSGWLRHIKAIMDAGIFIAKVIIRTFKNLH